MKITKEEFIKLYQTTDTRTLAEMLDCSVPTIYDRIKEFGISLKGQGKGKRSRRKLIIED